VLNAIQAELELLVRSRYPCVGLVSAEEERCLRLVEAVGQRLGRKVYVWSQTRGWTIGGQPVDLASEAVGFRDDEKRRKAGFIVDAIQQVIDDARGRQVLLVFKDLPEFFDEPKVVRKLLDLIATPDEHTVFFLATSTELPTLLEKEATLVDVPLPGESELRDVLMLNLRQLARDHKGTFQVSQSLVERVVRAALGLSERQADCVFRRAVTDDQEFDEEDLDLINQQKRQIIAKSGVLEFCEHSERLADVGGLDGLKTWLAQRQGAFLDKARAYGLPQPKGVFLLGVQGCGKSLVSKAISAAWHMPLLRLDVGSLFSSFIGKTEENLRNSLRVAESIAPCVLWVDEIEKGFSGVSGSGNTDGGTTARVFGTFITWMQEKQAPVFVVATANSIEDLPPELLRKGRFDEIFFVDLPTPHERRDIFRIQLARKKRDPARYRLEDLARAADGFSGAEIEEAIVAAMYTAFAADREFTTEDVLAAMEETAPLSQTMADRIQHLRDWASKRARWATTQSAVGSPRSPSGRLQAPRVPPGGFPGA